MASHCGCASPTEQRGQCPLPSPPTNIPVPVSYYFPLPCNASRHDILSLRETKKKGKERWKRKKRCREWKGEKKWGKESGMEGTTANKQAHSLTLTHTHSLTHTIHTPQTHTQKQCNENSMAGKQKKCTSMSCRSFLFASFLFPIPLRSGCYRLLSVACNTDGVQRQHMTKDSE